MSEFNDGWEKVGKTMWSPEEEGDSLVGVFLNAQHDMGPKKNSTLYTVEASPGKQVNIWGCAMLDEAMMDVDVGMLVKIVYGGKKTSSTGNSYHLFEVYKKTA